MKAVVLLAAMASCAPVVAPPMTPADVQLHGTWDHSTWLVGQPDRDASAWLCREVTKWDLHQSAYVSEPECDDSLEVRVWCTGVQCDATALRTSADVKLVFIPQEPGEMTKHLEVRDRAGHVKEWVVGHAHVVAVPPAPPAELACTTRDFATGEFEPCPTRLGPDRDLFVTIASWPRLRGPFEVQLDGKRISEPLLSYEHPALRCSDKVAPGDATAGTLACAGRLPPGHHVLSTVGGGQVVARREFDVLGPPQ